MQFRKQQYGNSAEIHMFMDPNRKPTINNLNRIKSFQTMNLF